MHPVKLNIISIFLFFSLILLGQTTYTMTAYASEVDNNVSNDSKEVEVIQEPLIDIKSFISNKDEPITVGETVTYTVEAEGEDLQYEWHIIKDYKDIDFIEFSNIVDIKFDEPGIYKIELKIKDRDGNTASYISEEFEVKPSLNIISLTAGNPLDVDTGKQIRWSVTAEGKGLQYEWFIYQDNKEIKSFPYSANSYIEYITTVSGSFKALVNVKDEFGNILSKGSEETKVVINAASLVKPSIVIATISKSTALYSSYTPNSKKISTLAKGAKVEIISDKEGQWYRVKNTSNNQLGWVKREFLVIPSDFKTDQSRMTKEQLEAYVNESGFESKTKYFIWVDLSRQLTHVFQGQKKNWKLISSMSCATGRNAHPTIRGSFEIQGRSPVLRTENPKVVALNPVRISGPYLFHSILVYTDGKVADSTLGKRASHGCIRLSIENSLWMHKNISDKTKVFIN
jgi:lipoprotein-anchoring transpeptidase ErfK/SrfK